MSWETKGLRNHLGHSISERELLNDRFNVDEQKKAIDNVQLEVWYQPQYNYVTKRLVGAEALIRWNHPTEGVLLPDQFLPSFEHSGLVYELDKYVWNHVCFFLESCIEGEGSVVPICVNVNQYDLMQSDIIDVMLDIVDKYGIGADLIHLEITEEALITYNATVTKNITMLRDRGFVISIDDFGREYSSFNTLKNVPIDIIKMDMQYLCNNSVCGRGGNIVEAIVRTAKWLNMVVIAECVEDVQQAEFLKSIGCMYIQGKLYSEPMCASDYVGLTHFANKEIELFELETVDHLDTNNFWNPKSIETLIFNSFVGGACIFEYSNDKIEHLRANDKYFQVIGSTGLNIDNALSLNWSDYLDVENMRRVKANIDKSIKTKDEVTDEFIFRKLPNCPEKIYLRSTLRVIAKTGERVLIYCTNENITRQRLYEQNESAISKQLKVIMDNISNGVTATVVSMDRVEFLFANRKYYEIIGYTKDQFNAELGDIYKTIYEEDLEYVRSVINNIKTTKGPTRLQFRVVKRDKTIAWLECTITIITFEDINYPIQLTTYLDVTKNIETRDKLKDMDLKIRNDNENLLKLMNDTPGGFARIHIMADDQLHLSYTNDVYCELRGMTYNELMSIDGDNILNSVHPDDLDCIENTIMQMNETAEQQTVKCRLKNMDGSYKWFTVSARLTTDETGERYLNLYYSVPSKEEAKRLSIKETLPFVLQAIMKSSTDLTFAKDSNFNYICCSHAFALFAGVNDESEVIGKSDYDLFDKKIADKFRKDDEKLFENRKSIIDMVEVIPSNDELTHYSKTSKYLLNDSFGNIIGLYGVGIDITEYRNAYERLQLLIDNMPGGIAMIEVTADDIRMMYYNDDFFDYTGYSKEECATFIKEDCTYFICHDDVAILIQSLMRLWHNKEDSIECNYHCNTKDGSKRYFNMRGLVSERSKERLTLNMVQFDITEQAKAEEEVRRRYEHEMQLRHELIKDSVVYYQISLTTGRIDEFISQYKCTTNISAGMVMNVDVKNVVLENVAPEYRNYVETEVKLSNLYKEYKKGITSKKLEYQRVQPNKERIWASMNITIMKRPDTEDVVAFIYVSNIDSKKKSQMAIETIVDEEIESVALVDVVTGLARFVHVRKNIVFQMNQTDCDFDFNKEYIKMAGLDVVKADVSNCKKYFNIDNLVESLNITSEAGHAYRINTTDGLRRKMSRAYYLDDNKREIVLSRRDITDLYEEEQKQKSKLKKAVNDANKANEAKSVFLSNMSHDMRTPLNAVLSYSSMEMTERADEERLRDYLGKIHLSGNYLLGIINDVLDMSKIEQNKLVLNPEPYDFDEFVVTMRNVIDELCKKRNITFVIDTEKIDVRMAILDKVRFNQIFINLLSNAVKFTPQGGKVELLFSNKEVIDTNHYIKRIIVRDNGIGMSEEFLPHAFESFKQEYREDVQEKSQGTGLGLSIVKKLVDMMGGTITVESKIDKGTTFTLDMPFELIETIPDNIDNALSNLNELKGLHILMAEDNEMNAEIVLLLLKKKGCIVDCVDNGKKALDCFINSAEGYYDAILMDIRMPVMNGLEASVAIRSTKRADANTVPIIALTADAFDEDKQIAKKAKMNDLLAKPLDTKAMYEMIIKATKGKL